MTETTSPAGTAAGIPAVEELLERARGLVPALRERGPETEELRRIPDETVEEFREAGILRLGTPVRFGGYGYGVDVITSVAMEVARGCGSSGWMSSFWPGHQFMIGWFPEEAQEEVWADSPDTLSSTVPAFLSIEREEVDGGLQIAGAWKFSSGIDHAEWAIVHTAEETCLVPRSDFEIVDDWYVGGLRGTGSKQVTIKGAFVPQHRIVSNQDVALATHTGARLYGSPWYRIPNPPLLLLPHMILAPVIGMANGVLDVFDERARTRRDPQSLQPAFERPGPQMRFAESSAEIDTAKMFLQENLKTLSSWGEAGLKEAPLEDRARLRRNVTYAATLCTRATNRLLDGADSSGVFDSSPLHRLGRDVRTGSLQFVLQWDETALQYARVHWGLEPNTIAI